MTNTSQILKWNANCLHLGIVDISLFQWYNTSANGC